MEEPRRTRTRYLAAVALVLGYSAAVACSDGSGAPVAPSPGVSGSLPSATVTSAPQTTVAPSAEQAKPGIKLTAVPRPDGSFDITENVRLPAATDRVPLQLPGSGEHLPGMMARTTPLVTGLKLLADDKPVPLKKTTITGADFVPLSVRATRIVLTYKLSGSTVRATPSQTSRAGAAIRPLTASAASAMPTDITITSGLLNVVCPLLDEPRCAVGDPPRLTVRPGIPAGKALVVLQLNLPR
ncbi:hypothetical protein EV649_6265 [Kribbella sp. VKM Ac-2569]|uniref:hypothetical protein n=1 Tax=Kribbella sp. VKM Ac-2569 TaxID=2512220 RepID=UPI0010E753AF|nr:hypothetical protein [Kribbella sp. VKM Ac-2569]RZT15472.1 hypothetical protein EV649_6265 [Kribbella sp. VKM Ac-2569]